MQLNNKVTMKELVEGFAEILNNYANITRTKKGEELLKMKETKFTPNERAKLRRQNAFRYGTNIRPVTRPDGTELFREKHIAAKRGLAAKIGGPLTSALTAISPFFIIGDLIWGDTQDD